MVTLYDDTRLVGCVVQQVGFCALHVSPDGTVFTGRTWCTAAANKTVAEGVFGFIQLAMDVDRRSFVAVILDLTASSPDYNNIFRVSMLDFEEVAKGTVAGAQMGDSSVKVFGAVPASQVRAVEGAGGGSCGRRL